MKTNAIVRIILSVLAIMVLGGILIFTLNFYRADAAEAPTQAMTTIISETAAAETTPAATQGQTAAQTTAAASSEPEVTQAASVSGDPDAILVAPGQAQEIDIEWGAGSVTVRAADVDQITITESGYTDSADALVWNSSSNNKLEISFRQKQRSLAGTLSKDLTVLVPLSWSGKLEIEAASAAVYLTDLTAREVEIDSASGICQIENCTLGELSLDTVSGAVSFTGTLTSLECDAVSASVTAVFENVPTQIEVESGSGDLDITLPANAGFTLRMESMLGSFTSDFTTTQQNGRYICGDGSCRITLEALSGSVTIRKA